MFATINSAAAFAGIAAADLIFTGRKYAKGRYFTKPLLMPLLALFYSQASSRLDSLIITALICCFLGDLFLLISNKQLCFLTGLVSFLIGHIVYTIAMLQSANYLTNMPLWFLVLLVPYLIFALLFLKTLNSYLSQLRIPVIIYTCVILAMSFSSLSRVWTFHGLAFWIPLIGSILFVLSDSLLAYDKFAARLKNGDFFVMLTYIMAQAGIVTGFILA